MFFFKKKISGNLIWIHVASVGELMSVVPLIFKLEKNKLISQILITSTTLSSSYIFKSFKFKNQYINFFQLIVITFRKNS